jgi:T5SS/PEP-CTERM-associated repeat protein
MALTRRKAAVIFSAMSLSAGSAGMAQTNWQADPTTPDDWFDNLAWSNGVPSASQPAYISNGGEASISSGNAVADGVYLGSSATTNRGGFSTVASNGSLSISGGQLNDSSDMYVGYGLNATGVLAQSGGEVSVSNLWLGGPAVNSYGTYPTVSSNGTYLLSGTGQLESANEYISNDYYYQNAPEATFVQSGNTSNTCTGQVTVGNGSYSMSSNSFLAAGSLAVGGTFTQDNSTVTANTFYVSGLNGHYNLNDSSSLTVTGSQVIVGYSYGGTLTQTDSTCNFNSASLYIGYEQGSTGNYTVNGNSQLTAGKEYIGYSGSGTFTQTGGINNVNGTFYLGYGGPSQYTLSGGLLTTGDQYIGRTDLTANQSSGANATFVQSGGTNNLGIHTLYMGAYNSTVSYSLLSSGTFARGK